MKRLSADIHGLVSPPGDIAPHRSLGLLSVLLAVLGFSLLGGCGYQWQPLYRQDVQTVAVPYFTNKDFRRGVELRLTDAVAKQIEAHTPYKVVPRDRADTVLEGQITAIQVTTISHDFQTNVPREQLMTLTIDLVWKNLHDGRILLERRGFRQSAMFFPQLAEGEFVGSQEALEKLALAIVQEMQAEW